MAAIDTDMLRDAQRALLDATMGDFPAPEPGDGWPVELVLAHVIATQRSFTALGAELLLGRALAYDNGSAGTRPYLEAIVAAGGDLEALRTELHRSGAELIAIAGRVDDGSAATTFPCRIHDGNTLAFDGPLSYAGLLEGHAR